LGTSGPVYTNHHSFIQFSKNHPGPIFQHPISKRSKGSHYREKAAEALSYSPFQATVFVFPDHSVLPTYYPSR
jgi:hypothetical protein